MQATATRSQIEGFQLKAGDVLITKDSESWDDIAVPAFVPKHLDSVRCGYHLALIRPDPTLADGEFRLVASPPEEYAISSALPLTASHDSGSKHPRSTTP